MVTQKKEVFSLFWWQPSFIASLCLDLFFQLCLLNIS
jgi:hypothetical protein